MTACYREQVFEDVEIDALIDTVTDLKAKGYRFGQLCTTNVKEGKELLYSFDKDHKLLNKKIRMSGDEKIPSITGIYWPAFIYENEAHDLFGVEFTDSKLDYGGKFFRLSEPTPWKDSNKESD